MNPPLDAEDALRREWLTMTPCNVCHTVQPLASLSLIAGHGRTCTACIDDLLTRAREATA